MFALSSSRSCALAEYPWDFPELPHKPLVVLPILKRIESLHSSHLSFES